MREYEYRSSRGEVLCAMHSASECSECAYVSELEDECSRYHNAIIRATDAGLSTEDPSEAIRLVCDELLKAVNGEDGKHIEYKH